MQRLAVVLLIFAIAWVSLNKNIFIYNWITFRINLGRRAATAN